MHNSELIALVDHDKRINDVIKNCRAGAVEVLLDEYRLSNDKTGFVAALIGALVVEKLRNSFKVSA